MLSVNLQFPAKRKMLIIPTPKNKKIAELTLYSWYKFCQTYYKIVFFKAIVFIKAHIDSNVIYMIVIDILIEYVCVYLYSNYIFKSVLKMDLYPLLLSMTITLSCIL